MFLLKITAAGLLVMFPLWDILWYLLGVEHIYPWQLKKMPASKRPFIIDVRTASEYQLMHIPKSIHRPDLLSQNKYLPFTWKQPLLVACMSGHRSVLVVKRLQKMGYKHVYNLSGGIIGWKLFGGITTYNDQD